MAEIHFADLLLMLKRIVVVAVTMGPGSKSGTHFVAAAVEAAAEGN